MHFSNQQYVLRTKSEEINEGIYTITSPREADFDNLGFDNSAADVNEVKKTKEKR